MNEVLVELNIKNPTSGVPRSSEEYWAKVRSDNNWYFSKDAIVFRMFTRAKILFKDVDEKELLTILHLMVSMEELDSKNGVPVNLRS